MSAQGPQVPPGWYPDPTSPNTQRYWDGNQWTQHVQPMVDSPAAPAPTTPMAQPTQPAPQQFPGQQFQEQQFQGQQFQGQQAPGQHFQGQQFQGAPGAQYASAPKKSGMSTATKVLSFLGLGFVLLLGGCTALIAFAANEAADEIAEIEEQIAEAEQAVEDAQEAGVPVTGIPGVDGDQSAADLNDGGTREDPFAYNETIDIMWRTFGDAQDSVWTTTVGPPRDITAEILAENEFNAEPPEGTAFVGFDVEMTLNSAEKEPLSPGFNFTWEILGGASAGAYDQGTIETQFFGCGVGANNFDIFDEVFVGGTLSGVVCIPLPLEDLDNPDTQVAMQFLDDSRIVFGP